MTMTRKKMEEDLVKWKIFSKKKVKMLPYWKVAARHRDEIRKIQKVNQIVSHAKHITTLQDVKAFEFAHQTGTQIRLSL